MPSNDYDAEATELLETYGQHFPSGDILPISLDLRNLQTF